MQNYDPGIRNASLVVVVFLGIPGSGKSTLCTSIEKLIKNQSVQNGRFSSCQVLSYDELFPQWSTPNSEFHTKTAFNSSDVAKYSWRSSRIHFLQIISDSITKNMQKSLSSLPAPGCHLLLIDDVLQLSSMRREIVNICWKGNLILTYIECNEFGCSILDCLNLLFTAIFA